MRSATNLAASARDYPAKPVRIIEPFGVGGGPDLLARALAPKLSELWGQPVTVENITGAGATAGPEQVAKSPADGSTLLINTNAQAYSAALLKDLPYDPLKDFIPIIPLTRQAYVLVTGKMTGVTTVGGLIAAAKAKPGELKFGSTGIGTGTHVGVEKFNQAAGIKALHVPPSPNDSNADTIANAVAERFTYYLVPISLALPHIRDGTLVALGVVPRGVQTCSRRCRPSRRRASPDSTSRSGMECGCGPTLRPTWLTSLRMTWGACSPGRICASGSLNTEASQ